MFLFKGKVWVGVCLKGFWCHLPEPPVIAFHFQGANEINIVGSHGGGKHPEDLGEILHMIEGGG